MTSYPPGFPAPSDPQGNQHGQPQQNVPQFAQQQPQGFAQPQGYPQPHLLAGPPQGQQALPPQAGWVRPRPRTKRRVVLEVLFLTFGGIAMLAFCILMAVITSGSAVVVSAMLALVPLLIVASTVVWVDRWEPEPRLLMISAFVWGGGIAVFGASMLNERVGLAVANAVGSDLPAEVAPAVFGAPLVEEAFKGLGLLLIFLVRRRQFNGPVDGVVYASIIAAAFAFTENIQYFSSVEEDARGVLFVMRGLLSPFGHLIYTTCMGLALGWASRSASKLTWLWALPLGYAAAAGLHALWNSLASGAESLGDVAAMFLLANWLPLLAAAVLVVWLRRKEIKLITVRLMDYVPSGWLAPHEVQMLTSLRTRKQARTWAARGGPEARKAMRQFQRHATSLAYARQDLHTGNSGIRAQQDEFVLLERMGGERAKFRHLLGV